MMFRRTFLAALVGLAGAVALDVSGARAVEHDPKAFVTDLASTAMEAMTQKGISDEERTNRFRNLFISAVDTPAIAKFVLTRYWAPASQEQQQEFIRSFEEIMVLSWAPRFKDYGGDLRHTVTNVTHDPERGVFVDSKVERQSQQPIQLQWRLKPSEGGLRVVDLVVEGSSMAITFRSEYASVIQANGGKFDGLLAAMRLKISQLKAGSAK